MRLFVAIEFSPAVRKALVDLQRRLDAHGSIVRWVPAEQLHLTVKFLGEVDDRKVAAVGAAVTECGTHLAAFDMNTAGAGCFPPRGSVRIVWGGVTDSSGRLGALVESVEAAMESQGFARERRPFSPHITIGRVREGAATDALRAAVGAASLASVDQEVAGMTLMSSVLSPRGPTYAPVCRARLMKA